MKHIKLYSDGACRGNPGSGGYGTILVFGEAEKSFSDGEAHTTNNRMELMGVIVGLEALTEPCRVDVYTDSKYVVDAVAKGWAVGWRQRGWIKADKKPALNSDLWERLLNLIEQHQTTFHWVKGHAGHVYNERCDVLATQAADRFR